MKLSTFISSLGWASIFCLTWLWLLGSVKIDWLHIGFYIMFWVVAIIAGLWSEVERREPR